MTDTEKRDRWFEQHKVAIRAWAGVVVSIFAIYWFSSDGDMSFLLTLSSLVTMVSFLMLGAYIETNKTTMGISAKMMELYLLVQVCRLIAIVPFDGYLPSDSTGDIVYPLLESVTCCLVGTLVYLCRVRYGHNYNADMDVFDSRIIVIPTFLLALAMHPDLNNFFMSDVAWAWALYLEAIASLPQLFMFQKEKVVHPWMAHFLAALGLAKATSFVFWASCFGELVDAGSSVQRYTGYLVVFVQGFQLLFMGDFLMQYVKCVHSGDSIEDMLNVPL